VTLDAEGVPLIPGRLGQIEGYCDGVDCHRCPLPGEVALAVWTDRARLFGTLWAIPGVRRWQEIRAVFPVEALDQGAPVIRARRKRAGSPEAAARMRRAALARAGSDGQEPAGRPGWGSALSPAVRVPAGAGNPAGTGAER
jgi:hypothetical protein